MFGKKPCLVWCWHGKDKRRRDAKRNQAINGLNATRDELRWLKRKMADGNVLHTRVGKWRGKRLEPWLRWPLLVSP
jgi:hypothetical protein